MREYARENTYATISFCFYMSVCVGYDIINPGIFSPVEQQCLGAYFTF